jgi:serralysin
LDHTDEERISMMANTYKGTSGDDNVVQDTGKHDYFNIYTYAGEDTVKLVLGNTYTKTGDDDDSVKSNIEAHNKTILGNGDDTYIGNGFSNRNNNGDLVHGNGGNDTFTVATAVSDYYGDGGKDTFDSAGYWNYFNGGGGTDTISYQRQDTDDFLEGRGVKVDLYNKYATTGGGREERLIDIENAVGSSFADTLTGGNGNNKLEGMDGKDVLNGRDGNDRLFGGNGGDNLHGGDGNDKLIGGQGQDLLEAGSGADTFIFQKPGDSAVGDKRDVIGDFTEAQNDRIDLSAIDAIKGGSDDEFDFIGTHAFSHTAGELRFKNGLLQADTDGDGKANFEVSVDHLNTMHDTDFIL